ncbi:unnamed protein product [Somion occarium]|uniref:HMG box domain-containing protein n=1 Tax=Somion occarium TaxID=3059160 RepID=A0ABP1CN93_9APHY
MHRYNPNAPLPSMSANAGHIQPGAHDRESSLSGSDTTYTHYTSERDDVEDDPHLALTSQTLNADGTPKRPMNAFMIFARKRRPQISAENQMMRTGEISKILSKEWTSMDMKDKKFYLDQAKKLKDNFNSKYPDYVYRRRPNNTRRKRKSDADSTSPAEGGETDDPSYEDASPVEGDYPVDHSGGYYQRSHNSSSSSGGYDHDPLTSQQTTSYSYHQEYHLNHPNPRVPELSGGLDSTIPVSPLSSVRMPSLNEASATTHGYSYSSYQQHSSSPVSPTQSQAVQDTWDSGRVGGRPNQERASWSSLPALDTSITRQRSNEMGALSARSDAFSPQVPNRPWSSSASSTASSSSGGAAGSHHLSSPFPTLASSFHPAFSPSQRSADMLPSPTSLSGGGPEFLSPSMSHSRGMSSTGRHVGQEHSIFSHSQTLPPPTPSTSWAHSGQWASQYPRPDSHYDQRQPPPISTYPLPHSASSASPPSSASGPQSSHYMPQWDRKYEGR